MNTQTIFQQIKPIFKPVLSQVSLKTQPALQASKLPIIYFKRDIIRKNTSQNIFQKNRVHELNNLLANALPKNQDYIRELNFSTFKTLARGMLEEKMLLKKYQLKEQKEQAQIALIA